MKITVKQLIEKAKIPDILDSLDAVLKVAPTLDSALVIQDTSEWLDRFAKRVHAKECAIMVENGGVATDRGFTFSPSEPEPEDEALRADWEARMEAETKDRQDKIIAGIETLYGEEATVPESLNLPITIQLQDEKFLELVKTHANKHVQDFVILERKKK